MFARVNPAIDPVRFTNECKCELSIPEMFAAVSEIVPVRFK